MATSELKTSIVIQDITEIAEMREVERLQKQVWGVDDLEVFPALALIPMREVGAVLLGAFDGDRMVGFVFGFLGYEHRNSAGQGGRFILHSDMLAVLPEYRAHGLGYRLKLAQRERALAQNIDTITWTFDPLQSANAHLNVARLGVIGESYRINYYGETTSFLHRSGTDRLWVTWSLNSERVRQRIESDRLRLSPNLNECPSLVLVGDNEEPVIEAADLNTHTVAIEIPGNINALLREDPERAFRWRDATRRVLTKAFDAGYVVVEFVRTERDAGKTGRYLLQKAATD